MGDENDVRSIIEEQQAKTQMRAEMVLVTFGGKVTPSHVKPG